MDETMNDPNGEDWIGGPLLPRFEEAFASSCACFAPFGLLGMADGDLHITTTGNADSTGTPVLHLSLEGMEDGTSETYLTPDLVADLRDFLTEWLDRYASAFKSGA